MLHTTHHTSINRQHGIQTHLQVPVHQPPCTRDSRPITVIRVFSLHTATKSPLQNTQTYTLGSPYGQVRSSTQTLHYRPPLNPAMTGCRPPRPNTWSFKRCQRTDVLIALPITQILHSSDVMESGRRMRDSRFLPRERYEPSTTSSIRPTTSKKSKSSNSKSGSFETGKQRKYSPTKGVSLLIPQVLTRTDLIRDNGRNNIRRG